MKPKSLERVKIPIVLTATIAPLLGSSLQPAEVRLKEYLRSIEFYMKSAPVFFIENSDFPLGATIDHFRNEGLIVRRFPRSNSPERGKGYQEFEMLDAWISSEPNPPPRWLKITGRYVVRNVDAILNDCQRRIRYPILLDQVPRGKIARTHLFCVETTFYQKHLAGLYRQCDDRIGDWIERIFFRNLKRCANVEVASFAVQPWISAIAGSTGAAFPSGRTQWLIKQALRSVNRVFDTRYLWYPR